MCGCMYVYVYTLSIYIYIYIYIHTHTQTHTHTYTHAHTHTHTHTHTPTARICRSTPSATTAHGQTTMHQASTTHRTIPAVTHPRLRLSPKLRLRLRLRLNHGTTIAVHSEDHTQTTVQGTRYVVKLQRSQTSSQPTRAQIDQVLFREAAAQGVVLILRGLRRETAGRVPLTAAI
jgi:hypothetical protein